MCAKRNKWRKPYNPNDARFKKELHSLNWKCKCNSSTFIVILYKDNATLQCCKCNAEYHAPRTAFRFNSPTFEISDGYIRALNRQKDNALGENYVKEATNTAPMQRKAQSDDSRKFIISHFDSSDIILSFGHVVIRCNTFIHFARNHTVDDVILSIPISRRASEFERVRVPGTYCRNCRELYILEKDYHRVLRLGNPICEIIDDRAFYTQKPLILKDSEKCAKSHI